MNYQLHPTVQALLNKHDNPRVSRFVEPIEVCITYDFDLNLNPYKPSLAEDEKGSYVKNEHLISIGLADKEIRVRLMTVLGRKCKDQVNLEYSSNLTEIAKAVQFLANQVPHE